MKSSLRSAVAPVVAIVALLVAWELGVRYGFLKPYQFPPVSRIAGAFVELSTIGFPTGVSIWSHTLITVARVLQGYVAALALAIPIGLLIGAVPVLDKLTAPLVVFCRSVATLSLLPLVIVWFGAGELTKVFLIGYGCFWVMLSNVIAGVRYVDPTLLRAASTFSVKGLELFSRVILPAALPRIFAGARMALGVGFMVIVGAEMIGTIEGLGALIMEARSFYRSEITIIGMLVIGLIGFVITSVALGRQSRSGASMSAVHRLVSSNTALGIFGTTAAIATWEILARTGVIDPSLFPSPSLAISEAAGRLTIDTVADNMMWSLFRVFSGFLLGALVGAAVGIAAGWYRGFGTIVRPVIELLRPIPPLAWIPLAIIWFGLGEPSKFFIIFLGAFFPVVTAAYQGMRSIDPVLLRAAQTMGLTGLPLLMRVAVPAAAPDLATGVRIGWGLSFGVLVAAELIAADRGLGYMIINERNTGGSVGVIIVGILLIGALNLLTDAALGVAIKRWVGRWHGT